MCKCLSMGIITTLLLQTLKEVLCSTAACVQYISLRSLSPKLNVYLNPRNETLTQPLTPIHTVAPRIPPWDFKGMDGDIRTPLPSPSSPHTQRIHHHNTSEGADAGLFPDGNGGKLALKTREIHRDGNSYFAALAEHVFGGAEFWALTKSLHIPHVSHALCHPSSPFHTKYTELNKKMQGGRNIWRRLITPYEFQIPDLMHMSLLIYSTFLSSFSTSRILGVWKWRRMGGGGIDIFLCVG